jgi:hypothetical protein
MEFTYTMEVFDGQEVVGKHACPAPHATCADVVADATWQALMSWNRSRHHDLKDSIYTLYPRRNKDAFKISRVDLQIFRGVMSHSKSLSLSGLEQPSTCHSKRGPPPSHPTSRHRGYPVCLLEDAGWSGQQLILFRSGHLDRHVVRSWHW